MIQKEKILKKKNETKDDPFGDLNSAWAQSKCFFFNSI